jgi:hypothetical protein
MGNCAVPALAGIGEGDMTFLKFATPSYNRATDLKTLPYLRSLGVADEQIYLFLNDADQHDLYKQHNDLGNVNVVLAEGCRGIVPVRNFIAHHMTYPFIGMDDDVHGFEVAMRVLVDGKEKPRIINRSDMFVEYLENATKFAIRKGCGLFGFAKYSNPFYMCNQPAFHIDKPFDGRCLGYVSAPPIDIPLEVKGCDDFCLGLTYVAHGGHTLRFNRARTRVDNQQSGGCNKDDKAARYQADLAARDYMIRRWGKVAETFLGKICPFEKYTCGV